MSDINSLITVLDVMDSIDFKILIKLSLVCKQLNIGLYWYKREYCVPVYSISNVCSVCKKSKPEGDFGMCRVCTRHNINLTNFTEVKKKWHVIDKDLAVLNKITVYMPIFKKHATYFDVNEARDLAICKHGPKRLQQLIDASDKRSDKNKEKRYHNVLKIKPIFAENTKEWNVCFHEYIESGNISLPKLRIRYEQYQQQYEAEDMFKSFLNRFNRRPSFTKTSCN